MNKRTMPELIKDVKALITNSCPTTYYMQAAEQKVFPYVVFDVRPAGDSRVVVELDLWGQRGSEMELLGLASDIEVALDEYIIDADSYTATLWSNSDMKWVDDENKDIRHINFSFYSIYQS